MPFSVQPVPHFRSLTTGFALLVLLARNNIDSTPVPVDDFITVDANITWTPKKDLEFMLAGQNLLNRSELEYIAELITPPTEIERGVFGKITWHL